MVSPRSRDSRENSKDHTQVVDTREVYKTSTFILKSFSRWLALAAAVSRPKSGVYPAFLLSGAQIRTATNPQQNINPALVASHVPWPVRNRRPGVKSITGTEIEPALVVPSRVLEGELGGHIQLQLKSAVCLS